MSSDRPRPRPGTKAAAILARSTGRMTSLAIGRDLGVSALYVRAVQRRYGARTRLTGVCDLRVTLPPEVLAWLRAECPHGATLGDIAAAVLVDAHAEATGGG